MSTGVELATAWVRLVPSMDGVQGEVAKSLGGVDADFDAAGKKSGTKFSKALGAAALAGAAVIGAGLVKVFNTGLEEIKFGEQLNAQTDILVKNTGFKLATSQINDYTLALSKVSGISEEDLQSAGNNILKFGDVSETTYKRAVDAINDMGAAGKDVKGTSEALGKALADPAAAAALLKRQGVILNDEQQKLITNFTAAGDKAGAQGVILDALNSTYDGMAEKTGGTLQGNLNKLQNNFENISGDLVSALMPALSGTLTVLQSVIGWVGENTWVIPILATAIGGLLVGAFIAWTASIWASTVALLANPVTWVILGIVALIAAVVLLVANWDAVVSFITTIWGGFISWITGVIDGFVGWWNGIWSAFAGFISNIWNGLVNGIRAIWSGYISWITGVVLGFVGWWNGIWGGVGDVIRTVFSNIASFIGGVWDGIVSKIRGAVNGIIGVINGMIGALNGLLAGIGNLTGMKLSLPKIPGLATGGTVTASGTVLVGENGPELLHLPKGASVDPDISNSGGRGTVIFNNNAPIGQAPAQALAQFANRAEVFL